MSGKSTVMNILKHALNSKYMDELGRQEYTFKVHSELVNPKSVSMIELFGSVDPITKNWTDGVLTHCLRMMSQNEEPELQQWCVLDGP